MRDGILYRKHALGLLQLIIPASLKTDFLKMIHSNPLAGHFGQTRTRLQVRGRAYWLGWSNDCKLFVRCCCQCQQRGPKPRFKNAPLQPIRSFDFGELWSIDIVGKCVTSYRGFRFILTMQDHFTKFAVATPIRNQEAVTVAKAFFDNVILRFGAPLRILSDQGSQFQSTLFKELCKLMEIKQVRTSPFYPQTSGTFILRPSGAERWQKRLHAGWAR